MVLWLALTLMSMILDLIQIVPYKMGQNQDLFYETFRLKNAVSTYDRLSTVTMLSEC